MPTPLARDGKDNLEPVEGRTDNVSRALATLLPTTRASDGGGGAGIHGDGGLDLRTAVSLLPTPKATNNENQQSEDRYGPNLGMALGITDGTIAQRILMAVAVLIGPDLAAEFSRNDVRKQLRQWTV